MTHKNLRGSPNLATSTGRYRRILLSNVGIITTEISLLLGKNTSLTILQIPHNFMGLLSLSHSPLALSYFFLVVHIRQGCTAYLQTSFLAFVLQKTRAPIGAASGTELVLTLLTQAAPIGASRQPYLMPVTGSFTINNA